MKKKVLFGMLVGLVMAAGTANAEHKLLVTEVLDAKQMEAQAKFEYTHLTTDFKGLENGKRTANVLESNYSLGVGLGHGLEVTASIPYVFSERLKTEFNNGVIEPEYEKRDGIGDFSFGAKYRIFDEEHKPFSLVAGLDIKFDTAGGNNAGTQTTDVSPYLAASKKFGHHLTPYAGYRAVIKNNDAADTHIATLGAEMELNETVTLDAKFDANFNRSTPEFSSFETYSLELASYIQVAHNFYLIPSVAVLTGSSVDRKDEDKRFDSPEAIRGGMSPYFLF